MIQKARKKPVEIEFMRWDGTLSEAYGVLGWITYCGEEAWLDSGYPSQGPDIIQISTLEGTMNAAPGDIIIKGVKGEFYPCKPDIFEQTYEVVEDRE